MKILVICQYYSPEPFRVSDICEELVKRGHEVTVVTGIPNYPIGEIYKGYRHGEKRDEVINGVTVHRCFTIGRKQGAFFRFLNYYSFSISSTSYIKRLNKECDVVFVNQLSPVMMANAGITYKKKYHKKFVMYCLDLWPESLVAGGIKRESPIYKFFHRVSEKIYKQADKILITSQSFSKYFEEEFGIKNTAYLPQYAEAIFTPDMCRKEPDGNIDLMFAGNIGAAQSVDTIINAAQLTKDIKNLRWHIVGDGSELDNLKKMAEDLDNVIFYGRKPLEEMPKYYSMADAMLVTMQKDDILSLTLPGKVQSYMASGKPIIGAIDRETKAIIHQAGCGLCADAENAEQLAKIVREFCISMPKWSVYSEYSVNYYRKEFSKKAFMNALEKKLRIYMA